MSSNSPQLIETIWSHPPGSNRRPADYESVYRIPTAHLTQQIHDSIDALLRQTRPNRAKVTAIFTATAGVVILAAILSGCSVGTATATGAAIAACSKAGGYPVLAADLNGQNFKDCKFPGPAHFATHAGGAR
jgi:hypothetical protein